MNPKTWEVSQVATEPREANDWIGIYSPRRTLGIGMKFFSLFYLGLTFHAFGRKMCVANQANLQECDPSRMRQRKNYLLATSQEREKFHAAFSSLAESPKMQQLSGLFRRKTVKESISDLFWLRSYLFEFEKQLQTFDPEVGLMYWDWAKDYPIYEGKTIDTHYYLGGVPNGECWMLIQFPKYRAVSHKNWDKKCIKRNTKDINSLLESSKTVNRYILERKTFGELQSDLRKFWPKRQGEEMVPFQPEDPKFLVYLTFLDKLYFDWQMRNPLLAKLAQGPLTALISPFNIPIDQVINPCSHLCYNYREDHFSWDGPGTVSKGKLPKCPAQGG